MRWKAAAVSEMTPWIFFYLRFSENEEVLYRTGRLVSHLSGRIVLQIARTMKNIDLERRQYYGRDRRNPVQGNEWRTDTSLRGRDERGEDTGVPEPLRQDRSTGNEENGPGTIRNDAPVRETDGAAYEIQTEAEEYHEKLAESLLKTWTREDRTDPYNTLEMTNLRIQADMEAQKQVMEEIIHPRIG